MPTADHPPLLTCHGEPRDLVDGSRVILLPVLCCLHRHMYGLVGHVQEQRLGRVMLMDDFLGG